MEIEKYYFTDECGNFIYKNSKKQLHREDGPALGFWNGYKCWFILNKYLSKKDFNSWIKRIKKCI